MTNSDSKCPHCKAYDWWHSTTVVGKNEEYALVISHCDKCGYYFKRKVKLHLLDSKFKLVEDRQRKLSTWQKFCKDGLKQGKSLKFLSTLYWQTWQEKHFFPDSLNATLTQETKQ